MNCESVIHLVRAHAEIYDPSHPNHQDSEHITYIWRIIAQELGPNISAEDAKRRWADLRTSYLRERRRLQGMAIGGGGGGGGSRKTSWPYFHMLTFLDDSIDEWRIPMNIQNIQQGYEYLEAEAAESSTDADNLPAKISNEEIINAVRPFEEVYDGGHPKHRNREHMIQVWSIIACQLKTNVVEAKKKWSYLRSNYMREKRKLNVVYPNGTSPRITWPYYTLLSFLDTAAEWRIEGDVFHPTYESDSLSMDYPAASEAIIIKSENEIEEIVNFPARKRKATDCAGSVAPAGGGIVHTDEIVDTTEGVVDTEGMCLDLEDRDRPDNEDPDFMFLRSLVPMMKMLGPIENLEFRGEVIDLLKRKIQQIPTASAVQLHY